jgi:hypothetical protein
MREQQAAGARPRDVTKRTLILAALATIAFVIAVGVFAMARTGGLLPAPTDRHTVAAPIDGLDVAVMESSPPQYMLHVRAGLPSGCAKQDSHSVNRSGARITVTVLNSMPAGDPPCTAIYGTYELNINLGTDFLPGSTYTVQVNDKATTFTAQ